MAFRTKTLHDMIKNENTLSVYKYGLKSRLKAQVSKVGLSQAANNPLKTESESFVCGQQPGSKIPNRTTEFSNADKKYSVCCFILF